MTNEPDSPNEASEEPPDYGKETGDPPVIMDDGGSTRIRQVNGRMLKFTNGVEIIQSALRSAKIVYLDKVGDRFTKPINLAITNIVIHTAEVQSLRVTPGANQTELRLLNAVQKNEKKDPKTGKYSYPCDDRGAISEISVNGSTFHTTSADTVYTMLHLTFI